jgi:hypothetical protein
MSAARGLAQFVALISLAAGLAGCGKVVGYQGAIPPAHTTPFPTEAASPLPAGADAMTALQQRPMRPPTLAPNETCSASSSSADLGAVAPNYGAGVGPVYMSGQDSWYSGGQVIILMVNPHYSGPLLVRAFQLGGSGKATVTLADLALPDNGTAYKEGQHGVAVVQALHTNGGGLYLGSATPSSFWRAWFGYLTTDGPGCFGLQVDGDVFTEFIVFVVNPGKAPPG